MRTRDVKDSDWPRLMELFSRQGFEYEFPDPSQFVVKQVVVDESDVPIMAVVARPTVELYLLADATWGTPGWRFEAVALLHKVVSRLLRKLGFQDAHIWVPPQLEKSFGKRLMKSFGWKRPLWTNFVRGTHE